MKIWFSGCLALALLSSSLCAEETPDTRTPVALSPLEKAYVLGQMRLFVESIETIAVGLADGNRPEAEEAAAARGSTRNKDDPAFPKTLGAKLPPEWKQFGGNTRRGFDTLASNISSSGDIKVPLKQLGEVMKNCVACHASYRIANAE
jgi:hypothetical protein